jgi:putative inorganic carbon (hco3(-)) transporter
MEAFSFYTYLLLIVSWFLHLPARLPFLGVIRFDFLLIFILIVAAFNKNMSATRIISDENIVEKRLRTLIIYIIVVTPFVEWPGSAIFFGFPKFIKVVVFYYFTVNFVTTERRLKAFIFVFLVCQVLRVVEPVFLNITTGYWGSFANMGEGEHLYRLSGAPYDVINPNGLAYVVLSVLPFMFCSVVQSTKGKLLFVGVVPVLLYALVLTGSRSGIIGFLIVALGAGLKNLKKGLIFISISLVFVVIGFSSLPDNLQDRYLSIISSDTKNAATASGRIEGISKEIKVALRRPFIGHGLGTSPEANYHFTGIHIRSHNLYIEVAEELGLIGLGIFLLFIWSIVKSFEWKGGKASNLAGKSDSYLLGIRKALQVWLLMNLIFSIASYGLTSYEWYLFAGLSAVFQKLSSEQRQDAVIS